MKRILHFITVLTFSFTDTNAQSFEITPENGFLKSASPELELRGSSIIKITGKRSRGTLTSPTAVIDNTPLFDLAGAGYNGSVFTDPQASIRFAATQNWASTANGTDIRFSTTTNNTNILEERMRLTDTGRLGLGVINPETGLHMEGGLRLNVRNSTTDLVSFKIFDPTSTPGLRFLSAFGSQLGGLGHGSLVTQLWRGTNSNAGLSLNNNNYLALNNANPTVPFHLNFAANYSTNSSNGNLVIGEFNDVHLAFDQNEINSWFNTAGNILYLNRISQGDVEIGNGPTGAGLDVNGYTNLGDGAPKIKMKKLSGITNSSEGSVLSSAFVAIPHGIGSSSKILLVDVSVEVSSNLYVPSGYTILQNRLFDFSYDNTNIYVTNKPNDSAQVLNKPIKILVTYEE